MPGDPLWLLIVAGPGGAKTETVQALAGAGAHVTSTIASEGALLSATPRRERNKKATGGLLRKIGDRGVLVIKDFTSILSADRNTRASVLAAIREVYDGRWERNVGTDGGADSDLDRAHRDRRRRHHGLGRGSCRGRNHGRQVCSASPENKYRAQESWPRRHP